MQTSNNSVFITGVSSGLGYGLAARYLDMNWTVYGGSRREPEDLAGNSNFIFSSMDLNDLDGLPTIISGLFDDVTTMNLVILNAGVLGEIKEIMHTNLRDIKAIMDVNLWANKVILDCLFKARIRIDQVVTISSGASVNGNKGWGGYSISKAALNMMTRLYAREIPETHFTALAPGLIDTPMQDYLCTEVDVNAFPPIKPLLAARNTPNMPKPLEAADNLIKVFPKLLAHESGSYLDVRNLQE